MSIKIKDFQKETLDNEKVYIIQDLGSVTVKRYLPVDEKLALIGKVATEAHDADYNFSNPLKFKVYLDLNLLKAYTDLEFTEEDLASPQYVYDTLAQSGYLNTLLDMIPEEEKMTIKRYAKDTVNSIYAYQNSAMGIMETLSQNYSDLDLDITKLQQKLANTQDLDLIKQIMEKAY